MSELIKRHTGRARYWRLTSFCVVAIIAGLYAVIATVNETSRAPVNVLATIVALAGVVILVSACVALFVVGIWRLRDRGKSGFWIIPYYAVPAVLALLSIDRPVPMLIASAMLVWGIIDIGVLGRPVAA